MGKNHNKNVQEPEKEKEVIEATAVDAPEETETEDAATGTEDNADDTPPEKKDDKEPKKESLIKKAATKVKGGVKKVLGKQFTIGQVLGLVAGVGAAVFIGKTIYERGQNDALNTVGGDADDDETGYLPVHEDESDDDREEVYDVEETEAEEVEESEDGDNDEVYDEEDVYDEDITE